MGAHFDRLAPEYQPFAIERAAQVTAHDRHAPPCAHHHRFQDFQRFGEHDAVMLVERSEEHTSELQSLMRISYAVFCLNKKNNTLLAQSLVTLQTRTPTDTINTLHLHKYYMYLHNQNNT